MDVKRALDTQRVKLLRLLTGWVVMLGVLSGGPMALPVPRWVRAFFETLLIRAEYAAQSLLWASVCLQATGAFASPIRGPRAHGVKTESVPSAQALIRRMEALRELLENLPRHARRLLRVQNIAGSAFDFTAPLRFAATRDRLASKGADWIAPPVERPPDKECLLGFGWCGVRSPCFAGGRQKRWASSSVFR